MRRLGKGAWLLVGALSLGAAAKQVVNAPATAAFAPPPSDPAFAARQDFSLESGLKLILAAKCAKQ